MIDEARVVWIQEPEVMSIRECAYLCGLYVGLVREHIAGRFRATLRGMDAPGRTRAFTTLADAKAWVEEQIHHVILERLP